MSKPNILYIHSHDSGRYVQPYGHAIPTPNIQRLAEGGVLFRQAFCAAPTCSPSRAALVTGQSAHSSGMIGLAHRGFGLSDYSHHILHTLRDAGYHSALSGVQHVGLNSDKTLVGYDEILEGNREQEIDAFLARSKESGPFLLTVGYNQTHRAYPEPGPAEDERYTLPPAPLPDTPETRRDMAAYKASARELDEQMGRVFELLEKHGVADNTLVICTTDHGIAFPRMKCNLQDSGIGVMLAMRWPDGADQGFEPGKVVDGLVSHIDIFPTVCEVLGIDAPQWLEGRSVMPVLRGDVREVNEEIFAEVTYHAAYEPQRCARTSRWKYIRRWGGQDTPVLSNCDNSPSKTLWMNHGWQARRLPREGLYDLMFDPNETNNLAESPDHATVLDDMRGRLGRWMDRTDDPLVSGSVDAPSGSWISSADGISPDDGVLRTP